MPAALFLRLFQVAVQLFDVIRVGVETRRRSDPALDFYEGVERGQVNGRARAKGWCLLLFDIVVLGEIREDQKVAYGAGYVGLGLVPIVTPEDSLSRVRVALVVYV